MAARVPFDEKSLVLGIDLGTTNSVVYGWDYVRREPRVYEIIPGYSLLPSVVSYYAGNWIVGQQAKNMRVAYPNETIASIKRHMGTDYLTDEINGKCWTPREISAKIIQTLISKAEEVVAGSKTAHLVIAHPYDFSKAAIADTLEATKMVVGDLPETQIKPIVEPIAAALACGIETRLKTGQIILVFDMGGGTLDITVFLVIIDNPRKELILRVIALGGDKELGGDNFDEVVVEKFKELLSAEGVDLDDFPDLQRKQTEAELEMQAEETKKHLTNGMDRWNVVFNLPGHPISIVIERTQIEEWFKPLLEKVNDCLAETIKNMQANADAGIDQINHVLLVGGSTHMSQVKELVKNTLKKEVHIASNTAEFIAKGAAYYSAMEAGILESEEGLRYKRVKLIRLVEDDELAEHISLPFSVGMLGKLKQVEVFWPIFYSKASVPTSSEELELSLKGGDSGDQDLILLRAPDRENREFFTGMEISEARTHGVEELGRLTFRNVCPPNGKSKDVSLSVKLDNQGRLEATLKLPEDVLTRKTEIPMT